MILINIQINPHDIAAFGISDLPYSVGVLHCADVARIGKMIHNLFTV